MTYLMLALTGVGLAFYSSRADQREDLLWAQLNVSAAVVLLADWVAFGWFQLYSYHPHLSPSPLRDAVWGEVLAEMIFVPGLSVFLDRVLPGIPGSLAGAGLVTGIEYAFLQVGLFSQHNWHLLYTGVGFAIYFWLLHRFWKAVRQGAVAEGRLTGVVRLSGVFNMIALLTLFVMAMGFVKYNLALMPTPEGNQALGRFLAYAPILLVTGYWVSAATGNVRLLRLAASVAAFFWWNSLLAVTGFQVFVPPWGLAVDAVARGIGILAAAFLLDRLNLQALAEGEGRARV